MLPGSPPSSPVRRASGEFLRATPASLGIDRDGPVSRSGEARGPATRMIDEALAFEPDDGPNALDLSSIRPAAASRLRARALLLPPAGEPMEPVLVPGGGEKPPREAVAAFAGYPPRPSTLADAPFHALAVLRRRRLLRLSLESARARRSPDVVLYEAAVDAADLGDVRRGIAVALVLVACALLGAFVLGETLGLSSPGLRP